MNLFIDDTGEWKVDFQSNEWERIFIFQENF